MDSLDNLPERILYKILDRVYPIGSPFTSFSDSRDPSMILGFGTWQQLDSVFVRASAAGATSLSAGGALTHAHGLSDGFAYIDPNGGANRTYFRQVSTSGWTADASQAGTVASSTVSGNPQGTELGGATDSGSNVPPYTEAYVWKRLS